MTNSGMTLSAAVMAELARKLRDDGGRVTWFGQKLGADVAMAGSRGAAAFGELADQWRGELAREGGLLDELGCDADAIARAVTGADADNGSALDGVADAVPDALAGAAASGAGR